MKALRVFKNMSNKAYLTLIRLLSSKDYSEHKLREKLRNRDFPAAEIDEAIAQVKEKNYLKEEIYAEARAKAFMNKGYSQNYIRQKLGVEHVKVDQEFIQDIYTDHNKSEEDQIKYLIEKKLRNKLIENYSQEVKIAQFVISKGHNFQSVKQLIKEYRDKSNYNKNPKYMQSEAD
jgi:regulatory protein